MKTNGPGLFFPDETLAISPVMTLDWQGRSQNTLKNLEKTMPTAVCPECDEEDYVDADSEQGDVVACDECGTDLEVVGLDPVELDRYESKDLDDLDDEDLDYDDDGFCGSQHC